MKTSQHRDNGIPLIYELHSTTRAITRSKMHAVKLSPIFGKGITTDVPRTRQRALLSPSVLLLNPQSSASPHNTRFSYTTRRTRPQIHSTQATISHVKNAKLFSESLQRSKKTNEKCGWDVCFRQILELRDTSIIKEKRSLAVRQRVWQPRPRVLDPGPRRSVVLDC
jgi:hypothetical protein